MSVSDPMLHVHIRNHHEVSEGVQYLKERNAIKTLFRQKDAMSLCRNLQILSLILDV